jgi:hypothetical protein
MQAADERPTFEGVVRDLEAIDHSVAAQMCGAPAASACRDCPACPGLKASWRRGMWHI